MGFLSKALRQKLMEILSLSHTEMTPNSSTIFCIKMLPLELKIIIIKITVNSLVLTIIMVSRLFDYIQIGSNGSLWASCFAHTTR